jgi:hypothetical protein
MLVASLVTMALSDRGPAICLVAMDTLNMQPLPVDGGTLSASGMAGATAHVMKCCTGHETGADSLIRCEQREMDMILETWNVRSV